MIECQIVKGVSFKDMDDFFCEACVYAKQTRSSFKKSERIKPSPGALCYTDICGPLAESAGKKRYIILFKDGATSYRHVYFVDSKSCFIDCLKSYNRRVRNKFGKDIQLLHSDNAKEIVGQEVTEFIKDIGAEHELTAPYTPEQNGRAERELRTIMESARAMLFSRKLPNYLWAEAVNTAVYILNRTPSTQVEKTPFEEWTGQIPSLDHIRTFGCTAYEHIPKQLRKKLEPRSKKKILVGYDNKTNNYRLFDSETEKVTISKNVIFNEDLKLNNEQFESSSMVRENSCVELNYSEIIEPSTFAEAMTSNESSEWKKAIKEELEALRINDTWRLSKLPKGKTLIGNKWVFKVKYEPNGKVSRFKARLVAKGYSQKSGVDYTETFSPTVRYDSVRALIALTAAKNWNIKQFDVKTAFLHGDLKEEIYLEPPEGANIPDGFVCLLQKSLYGLKQAPRCWNEKFDHFMTKHNFKKSKVDNCVYIDTVNEECVLLALYVDDGLVISNKQETVELFLKEIGKYFEIKIMDIGQYVGMEIVKKKDGSFFIHQKNYIEKILKKFGMTDANPVSIPADPQTIFTESDNAVEINENVPYREAVGSLMYAAIISRIDITFSVGQVSRFVGKHKQEHWKAVKRIFRYLSGTRGYGIYYQSNTGLDLTMYSDADFAGDKLTRKSTSGYVSILGGSPVTWTSQLQRVVALSTTEAEYIAAATASQEILWLRQLLSDLGELSSEPTVLMVDNQSAIQLIKNPTLHRRSKHIDIRFHFIRDCYENKQIEVKYVATDHQLADVLTKPLSLYHFNRLLSKLQVKC